MIKLIHMTTAFITIILFTLRGIWVLNDSEIMKQKWVKIVPHVNDTILLVTAIILAANLHQSPFVDNWLTAKVCALLAYIVLGSFALKRAKEKKNKILFFILALITFFYIVAVAFTRSASGYF